MSASALSFLQISSGNHLRYWSMIDTEQLKTAWKHTELQSELLLIVHFSRAGIVNVK